MLFNNIDKSFILAIKKRLYSGWIAGRKFDGIFLFFSHRVV